MVYQFKILLKHSFLFCWSTLRALVNQSVLLFFLYWFSMTILTRGQGKRKNDVLLPLEVYSL